MRGALFALALGGCSPCWARCHEAMPHIFVRWAHCDRSDAYSPVPKPRCLCGFATEPFGPVEALHVSQAKCGSVVQPKEQGGVTK